MGNHHFPIPSQMTRILVSSVLLIANALSPLIAAEEKGALPDILIQAEQKRPIQRTKPPMEFPVKEEESVESLLKTEDEFRLRMPSEVSENTRFVTNVWNSPYVTLPLSNYIVLAWKGEPAHVFQPLAALSKVYVEKNLKEAKDKARWELLVIDSAGKEFRKFADKGLPPDTLPFDGKSNEGAWMRVGLAYTAVLNYTDTEQHVHTALGRPFALAGLAVQLPNKNKLISLAAKPLFDTDKGPEQLSERGTIVLQEAAQLIARYDLGVGLALSANLSKPDPALAKSAVETCAKELSRELLLAPGSIKTQGNSGTPDLEERVDIAIGNF